MENQHEHLIVKSLSGSLPPEEQQELQRWLDEKPENRREYEEYLKVWQLSNPLEEIQDFQTSREWIKLESAIEADRLSQSRKKRLPFAPLSRLAVAASVTFLLFSLAMGLFLSGLYGEKEMIVMKSGGQEINFLLPDGSQVWLNRHSALNYPEHFNEEERRVSLSGEAFFEVEENQEKPFMIYAEKSVITVLGTSFNVKAFEQAPQTVVYVLSGSVSFALQEQESPERREVILSPGETAVLLKKDLSLIVKEEESPNVLAWKENQLVFKKAPLEEVAEALEDYFAVNISVRNPALLKCRFTSTFQEPKLEEVLEVLRLSLNLSITKDGNTLQIEGEGCK